MGLDAKIYISNDTLFEVNGLQNALDSTYQNSATVTMTIKDSAGTEVTGISWPLTFSYVAASNGNYNVTVDKAISVSQGARYFAEITAAQAGVDGFWRIPLLGAYRES